jgi:hypothetical protein
VCNLTSHTVNIYIVNIKTNSLNDPLIPASRKAELKKQHRMSEVVLKQGLEDMNTSLSSSTYSELLTSQFPNFVI